MHIRSVVVRGFDIAVLRTRDGAIRLMPNLRQSINGPNDDEASSAATSGSREKLVDHVSFEQGNFHFYDMTVGPPAFKVTVSNANATQALYSLYPSPVRRWIASRGGLKPQMIFLHGKELMSMYRPCYLDARASSPR